jgi:hypothetical protein
VAAPHALAHFCFVIETSYGIRSKAGHHGAFLLQLRELPGPPTFLAVE